MRISSLAIELIWFLTMMAGAWCVGLGIKEVYSTLPNSSVAGTALVGVGAIAICCAAILAVAFELLNVSLKNNRENSR